MRRWTTLLAAGTIAMGSVVGCGRDESSGTDADVTPRTETTLPAVSGTEPADEQLEYVVMGNSLLFSPSPGVMGFYREMLADHFGTDVRLVDETRGGQRTQVFLDRLRGDRDLRRHLGDADVILMVIPNDEWSETAPIAVGADGHDPSECGGPDALDCFRATVEAYKSMVDEIFAELMTVVDPSETLVRTIDFYVFTPGEDDLIIERLGPLWEEAQRHVTAVAARYGLPVAQVYDDFMGPSGTDHPEADGLVTDDGIHPTAAGARRIAELVASLGYEPVG